MGNHFLKPALLLVAMASFLSGCYETRIIEYSQYQKEETKEQTRFIPNRIIHTLTLKDGSLYNFYKKQEITLSDQGDEIALKDSHGFLLETIRKEDIDRIEYDRLHKKRTVAFFSLGAIAYVVYMIIGL